MIPQYAPELFLATWILLAASLPLPASLLLEPPVAFEEVPFPGILCALIVI